MTSTFTYFDGAPNLHKNVADIDSLDDDDDLSSLSDLDDDNSLDEYYEDELIQDVDHDTLVIGSNEDDDEVVVIPGRTEGNYTDADYSWRTGYTTNWKSYGNYNTSNNSNALSQDIKKIHSRSVSDVHLTKTSLPTKKRLSVDLEGDNNDSTSNPSSFFRSIGNWFRGSGRSVKSETDVPVAQNNNETEAEFKLDLGPKPVELQPNHVVGTSFSSFNGQSTLRNSQRKKIHFSLTENQESECEESSSTESLSPRHTVLQTETGNVTEKKVDPVLDLVCDVAYELYTTDNQQYICWQRQFRKTPGMKVCRKTVDSTLTADALIIPGNSFGFLDGEPELQYIKIFGWAIQKRLRQIICQNHDGELLVGEAIVLPMNISEGGKLDENDELNKQRLRTISVDLEEEDLSEREYCKTVKNLIYVPVMRVPILVPDTVNAYLAFRAAIKAVKTHNQNCDEAKKIQTVVCPQLCGDIGKMPAGRIALQMRTAYDAFVLNKRHDIKTPIDLGSMATNHVEMATAKNGNWC